MIIKKTILKRSVLLSLLLGISFLMKAQSISSDASGYLFNSNIGLSTPQVTDFMRHGNLNVEHYNGLLNLEIPLDGYQDNDFDLPMSVKYVSSGFIPSKRPSATGYNWMFKFGGVITRSVKGSPDDTKGNPNRYNTRYLKDGLLVAIRNGSYTGATEYYLKNFNMPESTTSRYVRGDVYHDFEPDIFQFSFGKHSGRFIIGNNTSPICLDGEGYKIDISGMTIQENSYTAAPQSSTIKITTPDGYIYEFGGDASRLEYFLPNETELIAAYVYAPTRHITAWHLKSITAPNQRYVLFDYESRLQPNHYYYFSTSHALTGGMDPSGRKVVIKESTYTPVLKKVRVDNELKLEFTSENGPTFFTPSDFSVLFSDISYFSHEGKIKEVSFDYTTKGSYVFLSRLVKGAEVYSFGYNNSFSPPSPLTLSTDHWGFWNGENTSLPNDIFVYCRDIEMHKATSGLNPTAGLLTSINYPTGGSTVIEYEQNKYRTYLFYSMLTEWLGQGSELTEIPCGGVRVRSIQDHDALDGKIYNSRTFEYRTPSGNVESGGIGIKPEYKTQESWLKSDGNGAPYMIYQQDASCNSLGRNENINEYHIGYRDVIERFADNSYIHYHYSSNSDVQNTSIGTSYRLYRGAYYGISQSSDLEIRHKGDLYRTNDLSHYRGKLLEKNTYNASNRKVGSEKYTYNVSEAQSRYNTSVASLPRGKCSYRIYLTPCLLKQKEITDENEVTIIETYDYNDRSILSSEEMTDSNGDRRITRYTYASDYSYNMLGMGEKALYDKNMLNKPLTIEKAEPVQNATEKILESISISYRVENNLPVVDNAKQRYGSVWKTIMEYPQYNSYGSPVYTIENESLHTVYLWGYSGQYIIAKIANATYDDVNAKAAAIGLHLSVLDSSSSPFGNQWDNLNALRTLLPQAQMTSYVHKPLVGITKITDPRGFSTYYNYDVFNRLKEIYIDNGSQKEVVETYEYNYVNQ